ncbi:formin-like protein 3 [Phocoena sinus]|uniref:formin-like protein 3 n=1 Tax=Phocoena sinus TaxID=42100 RepID=UPI0013C3E8AA|nr:formin-like protein 3 [Phocoena sinus]XP_032469204.1 formin-like protein 3 [Phocoena sinus]
MSLLRKNFHGSKSPKKEGTTPQPVTAGETLPTLCSLQKQHGPQFSPILPAQSDLPAFAPAGASTCDPLPRAITPSVRNRAPHTATSPSWTPGPGLRAREQEPRTRGFSVWWGEGGEGPQDKRLPEAGPSAPPPPPPPPEPQAGAERGQPSVPNGPGTNVSRPAPQAAMCPTIKPPLVTVDKASSPASSVCLLKADSALYAF